MKDFLKPCPFCGSNEVEFNTDTGVNDEYFISWIGCNSCGATAPNERTWNRSKK